MKNLLALGIGVIALGVGIWRVSIGETGGGAAIALVGAFLVYRGATGKVRQGL
jgi:hypothetical protein